MPVISFSFRFYLPDGANFLQQPFSSHDLATKLRNVLDAETSSHVRLRDDKD